MQFDAFISHSSRDKEFVRDLATKLKQHGVRVFFDEADLAIGDSLVDTITRAVQNARYVLIVMSPDYFASSWAARELDLALHSEFQQRNTVRVIPILRRDCEIPVLLRDKLYADFRTPESAQAAFPRLLAVFQEKPVEIVDKKGGEKKAIGQRAAETTSTSALESKIDALKAQVEAFIGNSQKDLQQGRFEAATDDVDSQLCFVVMPFGSADLNGVYEYFVKPTIEDCGLKCERGDDIFGSNVIMDDIRRSIRRARLIVADLTERNPNVFYEVGIAHTLNKQVLLLSQAMHDVPFDLRHLRVLVYDFSPVGCKKLERHLKDNINAMLNGD